MCGLRPGVATRSRPWSLAPESAESAAAIQRRSDIPGLALATPRLTVQRSPGAATNDSSPTRLRMDSAISNACGSSTSSATANSRSEEHTSELQSLMLISYADFCLQNKKTNKREQQIN